MRKQAFDRKKNTLAILVAFLVVISMTATVVSAAGENREHQQGGNQQGEHHQGGNQQGEHQQGGNQYGEHRGQGEHHFRNWHESRHHGSHDHYYGGTYYPNYEWVYNPATLVWDWTYLPVAVEQPVVTQPVEVVTTPAVVDYGYGGGYYDDGHHRYHEHDRHGDHAHHHND